ncbi:dentin sialophosphoprotein-like protein [Rhynchospora pubera]|uniref:Dentin sialophosphoprotein-like protein n=1 Tax=Rhynchospora pubera TaxID=906938 RepID=A0AAV8DMI8_9POAL|nr:dentin sialophosphoprotein-like protein [Rhynchospora pubera]
MSQLWQQQLLYKQMQLQELQRQQQQQQQQAQMNEMPAWQNNSSSQIAMANPSSFSTPMQEMPSWSNHSPQIVANPQMSFPIGNNVNWMQYGMGPASMNNFTNGVLMQQNNQLQSMRSMGLVPQQVDPSFYQNSQFLGMAGNANTENMLNKTAGSGVQSDTFRSYPQTVTDSGFATDTGTTPPSNNTMQNFLGSSFNNAPVQGNTSSSVQDHWSLQDKTNQPNQAVTHSGPTTGGSSLDPEEEKLLYGDDNWVGSFARSAANSSAGGGFMNSLDDSGNNFGGALPSLQSGSWSALMQEALDASSSENGQNEEWSGLTVHKTEVPVANQLSLSSTTMNNPSLPNFQQNVEDVPPNNKLSYSHEQDQLSNGMWAQRSENSPPFVQRGPHGVWVPQQNRPAQNNTNQSGNNRQNGWNSNNTPLQTSDNSSSMLMQPPKIDGGKNLGSMNSNLSKGSQEMSAPRWAQQTVDSSGKNVAERRTDESKQEGPILFPNPNPLSRGGSGFSSHQLGIGAQISHSQSMGTLGVNYGPTPFGSHPLLQSQLNQQSGAQMPKNQEQRFGEQGQHFSGMLSDIQNDPTKRHAGDEEPNSRVSMQNKDKSSTLYNGSMPLFTQNRPSQPSQNMLELFQKVEKVPKTDNTTTPIPGQSGLDSSTTHHHQLQPSIQGFGLMLGPPSQKQPTSSHTHSPDISIGNKQQNRETLDANLASTSCSPQLGPPSGADLSSPGETTENIQNQPKEATFSPNNQNSSDNLNWGANQQTGAANMFKNVWTNVTQQRNLTPSMIQSMMLQRGTATNLGQWGPTQGRKGDSDTVQPDIGTSSAGSQNQEERHMLEGNSMQGIVGSKRGASEAVSGSPANGPAIGSDAILQGHPLTPNAPQSTYSLLHQVQAMKGADLDPGNRIAKKPRGPDHSLDTGPRMIQPDPRMIQAGLRAPLPDGKASGTLQGQLTPEGNMLSFMSRENEERAPSVNNAPNVPTERPKISPQMAPSWFGQYGNNRNGQNLPTVYEGQRTSSTPQFTFPKPPWNMENNENSNNNNKSTTEKALDRSPITKFGQQNVPPNNVALVAKMGVNETSQSPLQSGASAPVVVKEKKRKDATRKLVPYHKVIEVPESIRSTSVVEMDWAQTANRIIDKMDDEVEMLEEGQATIAIPRRRLILTTKLTQHLIPAVPPRFLRAKADTAYESITFVVSNFALRDACSLICSVGSDSCLQLKNENALSERSTSVEKRGESFFSKVVESFNGRFKKMEEGFIRLNKRTSVLEFQLECQELEMFSVINRMGKFHRRHIVDGPGGDTPSSSRAFLQRAITAVPMPKNIQEGGINCLSL